jgi:hypothetical protein
MSWLSKFIFDPILTALSRAASSGNPAVAAAGLAALNTYSATSTDVKNAAGALVGGAVATANTTAGQASPIIADLEDGLRNTLDAYLGAALPLGLGKLAQGPANAILAFGEQHAHDYIASLFHHAKATAVQVMEAQAKTTAAQSSGGVQQAPLAKPGPEN